MRSLCPVCRAAVSHNRQGGPCLACYRAGCSELLDATDTRTQVVQLLRHMTATDLAELVGCSRQAIRDLQLGRTARVRPGLAAQIAAQWSDAQRCDVCDDVETALYDSGDPVRVAQRLGRSANALSRHLYRCGRYEWARLFGAAAKREAAR